MKNTTAPAAETSFLIWMSFTIKNYTQLCRPVEIVPENIATVGLFVTHLLWCLTYMYSEVYYDKYHEWTADRE